MIYSIINHDPPEQDGENLYLSGKEQYVVSDDENIVVFVLDAFSNYFIDEILKADADALVPFQDFIYYDSINCTYIGTFPEELHMLTGWEYNFDKPWDENISLAWSGDETKEAYQTLQDSGYDTFIYTIAPNYLAGEDMSRLSGIASNLKAGDELVISEKLIHQFIRMSFYRYVPLKTSSMRLPMIMSAALS